MMRPRVRLLALVLSVVVLASATATVVLAHGGGLDSQGGHNDRKAGTYHFHRGPLAGKTFASKAEATAALREAESGTASQSTGGESSLSDYSSEAKIDAVIALLVRKGLITQADLEAELRRQR